MKPHIQALLTCGLAATLLAACAPKTPAGTPPVQRETIVSLTFDDGDADNFAAAKTLKQYGLHATWYIPTGLVGTTGYMTWDQLQTLHADGNEIGGHSVDHVNLGGQAAEELQHQVCDSRKTLQEHGFDATSFAYPFGGYDDAAKQMARDCGYSSARSIGAGPEDIPPLDAFALRAYPYIVNDSTFSKLQRYVTGMRKEGGGWMILIFHHVCDGCDYFAVRADVLERFVNWLADEQSNDRLKVRTVGEIVLEGIR